MINADVLIAVIHKRILMKEIMRLKIFYKGIIINSALGLRIY